MRRLAPGRVGGLLVAALLALAAPCPADDGALEDDIALLAGYLENAVADDGRFVYRRSPGGADVSGGRYNILRHAGATWALAEHQRRHGADAGARAALLRAVRHLHSTIGPLPEQPGLLAVWSRPEHGERGPLQAKLGGTGLALLALTAVEVTQPGTTPLRTLRSLAGFACFMQKPSGDFHAKYVPSRGGRDDRWASLYYPGEAALGLLALHELDPQPAWFDCAQAAIEHIARRRAGHTELPADHWALIASERLLAIEPRIGAPVDRALVIDHAVRVAGDIVAGQRLAPAAPAWLDGGFTDDGRTAPAATRLEAIAATSRLLPAGTTVLGRRLDCALAAGVRFLRRGIVRGGPAAGGVTRSVRALAGLPEGDARDGEIRIDQVQHALSVLMAAAERPAAGACGG